MKSLLTVLVHGLSRKETGIGMAMVMLALAFPTASYAVATAAENCVAASNSPFSSTSGALPTNSNCTNTSYPTISIVNTSTSSANVQSNTQYTTCSGYYNSTTLNVAQINRNLIMSGCVNAATCTSNTVKCALTVSPSYSVVTTTTSSFQCCASNATANTAQGLESGLPVPGTTTVSPYKVPASAVYGSLTTATVPGSQLTGTVDGAKISGTINSAYVEGTQIKDSITTATLPMANIVTTAAGSTGSITQCTNNPSNLTQTFTPSYGGTNYNYNVNAFPVAWTTTTNGGTICPGVYNIVVSCGNWLKTGSSCGGGDCGWAVALTDSANSVVAGKLYNSSSAAAGSTIANGTCIQTYNGDGSINNACNPGDGYNVVSLNIPSGIWDTHAHSTLANFVWGIENLYSTQGATCTITLTQKSSYNW